MDGFWKIGLMGIFVVFLLILISVLSWKLLPDTKFSNYVEKVVDWILNYFSF